MPYQLIASLWDLQISISRLCCPTLRISASITDRTQN